MLTAVSTIAHPTASYAPATTSYAAAPASYTASYAPAAMTYAAPTYAAPTYAGPATTYAAPATTSYVPVASAPTYILQAVVPAIAQVEPCHAEIAEDAETGLLVLTFCPKPLDDADRKKLMEALEKKAEADRKKTALQLQEADEKALTAEKEFWDGTVPVEDKKAGLATGTDITQIGQAYHRANSLCQVLKARIKNFHPADVKPDGSGTRSYMFEIEEDPNVSDFDKEEAKKKDLVLGAKKIKNNVRISGLATKPLLSFSGFCFVLTSF